MLKTYFWKKTFLGFCCFVEKGGYFYKFLKSAYLVVLLRKEVTSAEEGNSQSCYFQICFSGCSYRSSGVFVVEAQFLINQACFLSLNIEI
ncbi:unnamed protein product [Urochloa humidicola]